MSRYFTTSLTFGTFMAFNHHELKNINEDRSDSSGSNAHFVYIYILFALTFSVSEV